MIALAVSIPEVGLRAEKLSTTSLSKKRPGGGGGGARLTLGQLLLSSTYGVETFTPYPSHTLSKQPKEMAVCTQSPRHKDQDKHVWHVARL